jgi:hypothetical protein
MNYSHPTEKDIQQYAIDKSECSAISTKHIETCSQCRFEVETYLMMFSEIKEQPAPVFDFDLYGLVLSQLPERSLTRTADNVIAGFLAIFSCCCIGIPLYVFRKLIQNMFMDIPSFFAYAIVISTIGILSIKVASLYKRYLNQIRFLDFK